MHSGLLPLPPPAVCQPIDCVPSDPFRLHEQRSPTAPQSFGALDWLGRLGEAEGTLKGGGVETLRGLQLHAWSVNGRFFVNGNGDHMSLDHTIA